MAFDPVPWAVSGSQLDTFVMREFANIATRNAQGVQLPGHGKVTASGPGNVNIAAGGILLRNAQAGGQSYIGRIASDTLWPVPGNSTGSPRSDLIVAYIIDPDFAPWQPSGPTQPNTSVLFGPYFLPGVIAGVPSSTTKASQVVTYTAYELARVDWPPNTTNIALATIVDLRQLAQPRVGFAMASHNGPAVADHLLVSQTSWRNWPTDSLSVGIPDWATNLMASIRLNQVQTDHFASDFQSGINVGGVLGISTNFDYNGNTGLGTNVVEGVPLEIFADIPVSSLQGQVVTVSPQAQRIFVGNTGDLWFDSKQQLIYDLRFVERTV